MKKKKNLDIVDNRTQAIRIGLPRNEMEVLGKTFSIYAGEYNDALIDMEIKKAVQDFGIAMWKQGLIEIRREKSHVMFDRVIVILEAKILKPDFYKRIQVI